jgi:hypothetical protein
MTFARAAELTSSTTKDGKVVILLAGVIAPGDNDKFLNLVRRANNAKLLVSGIRLNSPGGDLAEGLGLAQSIKTAQITTVVVSGGVCASACFLAFAGGAEKYVSFSGRVGVHGASDENGVETTGAAAATVGMARAAKELGASVAVLGKMVITPPDKIVWLSPDDLRSMGTIMVGKPDQTQSNSQAPNQLGDQPLALPGSLASAQPLYPEPSQIVRILQAEGYAAKLTKDSGGDPQIESSSQGAKWIIWFYNCNQHTTCRSIQFTALFNMAGKASIGQANDWNLKQRFATAALDNNGDLSIRMDVGIDASFSEDLFKWNLSMWNSQLGSFLHYIGFN